MEDTIASQSNQDINLEIQFLIKIDFPQPILILNINHEFNISILANRVPRSVPLVVIFFSFPEDMLWRSCLDTVRCAPMIPYHFHCLVIMANDEAQKKCLSSKAKNGMFDQRIDQHLGMPN